MSETTNETANEVGMVNKAPEFVPFPKMPRLSREVRITEKIDGTNGCVLVTEWGDIIAGSRSRWITPKDDNFGFAAWVEAHKLDLLGLGHGRHFGEWWGSGIQRGYGLTKGEKRFSLFNANRWHERGAPPVVTANGDPTKPPHVSTQAPPCCLVVPTLWTGPFDTAQVDRVLAQLAVVGSVAAPGFMKPEGVVVFHAAGNFGFKKTLDRDGEPKGQARAVREVAEEEGK